MVPAVPEKSNESEAVRLKPTLQTYQGPRQKRARQALEQSSFQFQSPKRKRIIGSSPSQGAAREPDGIDATTEKSEIGQPDLLSGFELLQVLGKTPTRVVQKAKCLTSGQHVALKIIDKRALLLGPRSRTAPIRCEAELLSKLQHPGVVRLQSWQDSDGSLVLVMEYLGGGNLLESLSSQGCFAEPQARRIFKQLSEAMLYVHGQNVVHRDLKPENILLSSTCRETATVKISDFGLSRLAQLSQECHTFCGSLFYTAPEVIQTRRLRNTKTQKASTSSASSNNSGYGKPADMWSLGVVLYVLLSGMSAFDGEFRLEDKILRGLWNFDLECWRHISDDAKDLVSSLMTQDPKARLSAQQVLQHAWLAEEDR